MLCLLFLPGLQNRFVTTAVNDLTGAKDSKLERELSLSTDAPENAQLDVSHFSHFDKDVYIKLFEVPEGLRYKGFNVRAVQHIRQKWNGELRIPSIYVVRNTTDKNVLTKHMKTSDGRLMKLFGSSKVLVIALLSLHCRNYYIIIVMTMTLHM